MKNNETTEKELTIAPLEAAVELIQGINAGLPINALRTQMERIADDVAAAACEKLWEATKMKMMICSGKDSCGFEDCGHAKPHDERGSCHATYCPYACIEAICEPIEDD